MTLVEIYADLLKRGVRCFSGDYRLETGADAVAVHLGDSWGVFLDERRIRTSAEEKVAVSHEWAHIVEDATYGVDAPAELVKKAEVLADRKQIEAVLPWRKVARYLRSGMQPWEIAEAECLTEAFVQYGLKYWTETRGRTA